MVDGNLGEVLSEVVACSCGSAVGKGVPLEA